MSGRPNNGNPRCNYPVRRRPAPPESRRPARTQRGVLLSRLSLLAGRFVLPAVRWRLRRVSALFLFTQSKQQAMNIAPVQKGVYTLGKRTEIPGMGKFDALSQMKVRILVSFWPI